jgi:hypothetical protein
VNDFGDIDLGACVWCKARSVACSTAQRRRRGGPSKPKAKEAEVPEENKQKVSEVESEDSEEEPLAKKFKSKSVIEDSEEEWEEWNGIEDEGEQPKELGEEQGTEEVREEVEEVREVVEEVREEITEEVREVDKKEAKRERREARRWEREARRSERSDRMDELIDVVRELGDKVDRFAEEVRVSNVLRNREDREYLEERRRWYFSDRMLHARNWQEEDSDVDLEGHLV